MLYKKLNEYYAKNYYPFHMPGHKRNSQLLNDSEDIKIPYNIDITEIEGFDDLHNPTGILKDCMDHAKAVYGADKSYFLVNGSTCGILSAISAVTAEGDIILAARNSHKAVYNGIYLNHLDPIYLYPETIKDFGINGRLESAEVEKAFIENPKIRAVIITSPTYEGIVSDIEKIAYIAHKYNVPLIVDEAHGAHFKYHSAFPDSALVQGADIVIQSLHKTLPSLTQTAILHVRGNLINIKELERYLSVFQSSSPSYILMASIDRCIRYLEVNGETLFDQYIRMLEDFYSQSKKLKHIKIADYNNSKDISKIVISVKGYNEQYSDKGISVTGSMIQKILFERFHLEMELAGIDYVLAMTSCMDSPEGFRRLLDALETVDAILDTLEDKKDSDIAFKRIDSVNHDFVEDKIINLRGKQASSYIYLYPPGIPILAPGEICTDQIVEQLIEYSKNGLTIHGL